MTEFQLQKNPQIWIEKGLKQDSWIRFQNRLKNSWNMLGEQWTKLWSTGRYAPHSELTWQKAKGRTSTKK